MKMKTMNSRTNMVQTENHMVEWIHATSDQMIDNITS